MLMLILNAHIAHVQVMKLLKHAEVQMNLKMKNPLYKLLNLFHIEILHIVTNKTNNLHIKKLTLSLN